MIVFLTASLWNTYIKCGYPVTLLMFCLIGMINCKQLCVGMGLCQGRYWFRLGFGRAVYYHLLYLMFINTIIIRLQTADIGCHTKGLFAGCLLYGDDVILLSPSVLGLQRMLDVCYSTSTDLSLECNGRKSYHIYFGWSCKHEISDMKLGDYLDLMTSIIYLGVTTEGGKIISFSINNVKRYFFTVCNCVFTPARNNDEIAHLSLQESYCRPILTYGVGAMTLTVNQYRILDCCWNTVY
jgi:hypothetical protein